MRHARERGRQLVARFHRDDRFAGYTIIDVIGQGGMGTVYLAQHPRLPQRLALKVLDGDVATDDEFQRRFLREADVVARLDHPGIIGVSDRGEEAGHLWIAMPYIHGIDASRVPPGTMSIERAARILRHTANALDYAHSRGVLHRDVKPANILLADADVGLRERVVLSDFGIASMREASTRITRTGAFTATLAFASPEQLSGGLVDHRSDQYSLACTIFALLTGRPPFVADNPAMVIAGHLSHGAPNVTAFRPDVPHPLATAIARAMSKSPADRFATCGNFAAHALPGPTVAGTAARIAPIQLSSSNAPAPTGAHCAPISAAPRSPAYPATVKPTVAGPSRRSAIQISKATSQLTAAQMVAVATVATMERYPVVIVAATVAVLTIVGGLIGQLGNQSVGRAATLTGLFLSVAVAIGTLVAAAAGDLSVGSYYDDNVLHEYYWVSLTFDVWIAIFALAASLFAIAAHLWSAHESKGHLQRGPSATPPAAVITAAALSYLSALPQSALTVLSAGTTYHAFNSGAVLDSDRAAPYIASINVALCAASVGIGIMLSQRAIRLSSPSWYGEVRPGKYACAAGVVAVVWAALTHFYWIAAPWGSEFWPNWTNTLISYIPVAIAATCSSTLLALCRRLKDPRRLGHH